VESVGVGSDIGKPFMPILVANAATSSVVNNRASVTVA